MGNYPNKKTIIHDTNLQTEAFLKEVAKTLNATEKMFLKDNEYHYINGIDEEIIDTKDKFIGTCNMFFEYIRTNNPDNILTYNYTGMSKDDATLCLNNNNIKKLLRPLKFTSISPIFNENFDLIPPGYDHISKSYYMGKEIKPLEGTKHIEKLLSEFCFKNKVIDKTNFIGLLLIRLLLNHYIGKKPGGMFDGNQPGTGKTELACILSYISDGDDSRPIIYSKNDDEFLKQLVTKIRKPKIKTILIDNIKSNSRKEGISSPTLEMCITSNILDLRILGSNTSTDRPNDILFLMTMNNSRLYYDMITRVIPVQLEYEGDPRKRKFNIDIRKFAIEHRKELLGELVGMVKKWVKNGKKQDTNIEHRCSFCVQSIGGILKENGYEGFLENFEECIEEFDPTRWIFNKIAEYCKNTALTINEIKDLMINECKEDIDCSSFSSKKLDFKLMDKYNFYENVNLGKFLGKYIGKNVYIDTTKYFFCKIRNTKEKKSRHKYCLNPC